MQCETKIPVPLVLLCWGLFIAVVCVFLGVVQQIRLKTKKPVLLVYVHVSVSQFGIS